MKKLLLILIMIPVLCMGQSRYHTDHKLSLGILNEPRLFWDGQFSIGVEGFFSEKHLYVHPTITTVTKIDGGYVDIIAGGGLYQGISLNGGVDNIGDVYAGPRLGGIIRGGKLHPTAGMEIGFNVKLFNGVSVGGRSTLGWRSDFDFWDGKAEFRNANFAILSFEL